MDTATGRAEMGARSFGRFLEIRCIHLEERAAYRAITAGSISQDRAEKGGFQICVGLYPHGDCFYPVRRKTPVIVQGILSRHGLNGCPRSRPEAWCS